MLMRTYCCRSKGLIFDVRFNSTLDRQLTQGFKDAVGREIERIKQNVEKAVREKIDFVSC
jgi:hypothetical protein